MGASMLKRWVKDLITTVHRTVALNGFESPGIRYVGGCDDGLRPRRMDHRRQSYGLPPALHWILPRAAL